MSEHQDKTTTIHSIVDRDDRSKHQKKQDAEIEKYKLVGPGGWPDIALIFISALLGYWNFKLFADTIPGIEGQITGLVALSCEGTAYWCVHYYTRSTGSHQVAMKRVAVVLGLFSLTHATMSVIHKNGYSDSGLQDEINHYSHVISFPLLLVLLTLSLVYLKMSHWSAKTARDLGELSLESLTDRAKVLLQQTKIRSEHSLARLRARIVKERTQLELSLLPLAKQFIASRQERERILEGIENPVLRRKLSRDLGKLFDEELDVSQNSAQSFREIGPSAAQAHLKTPRRENENSSQKPEEGLTQKENSLRQVPRRKPESSAKDAKSTSRGGVNLEDLPALPLIQWQRHWDEGVHTGWEAWHNPTGATKREHRDYLHNFKNHEITEWKKNGILLRELERVIADRRTQKGIKVDK